MNKEKKKVYCMVNTIFGGYLMPVLTNLQFFFFFFFCSLKMSIFGRFSFPRPYSGKI